MRANKKLQELLRSRGLLKNVPARKRKPAGPKPPLGPTLSNILLELPKPPSLNNAFINIRGRGRIKSPEYREWQTAAHLEVNRQAAASIRLVAPPYDITISAPRQLVADLDNIVKPIFDLLVAAGVMTDDRYVMAYTIRKELESREVVWVTVRTLVDSARTDRQG